MRDGWTTLEENTHGRSPVRTSLHLNMSTTFVRDLDLC